ncbi:MAG: beta-lactamase family protein [Clostridiales bacterium]|nr:beta-lactamase family protein [Clostridiales bacterium]
MRDFLNCLEDYVRAQGWNTFSIAAAEGDGDSQSRELIPTNACQNVYSIAKTYTMTAIGFLYDRGLVQPDTRIVDILNDEIPSDADERWGVCTVDMALRHRLGLPGGFLDIDCEPSTNFGEDFLTYLFKTPLIYDPDTDSRYSDGAYYLLSRIVGKISGQHLDDFLWKELFVKTDVLEVAMSHCPYGHPIGASGLYIRSSDMVKLGQLYLLNGVYKGKRLLSEEWVKLVLDREYALNWDETHSVYSKGGMHGQKLVIDPVHGRAACMESFGANGDLFINFVRDFK